MKLLSTTVIVVATLHICIDGVFIESPMPLNVTLGGIANFTCVHTASDFIGWRVNGSSADKVDIPCVRESTLFAMSSINPIHVLTIEATPECNNTVVECVALQVDPPSADFSPNVSLRVQGPLGAVPNPVVNLNSDSNGLRFDMSWEAPFSLDLTNVDPDIVYCVQMVNITCGTNTLLFSNCSILENELSLVGFSDNQAYEFMIFPRNNVKEALNGTQSSIRVDFTEYSVKYTVGGELEQVGSDEVVNVQLTLIKREDISTLKTTPKYYSLSLHPLDGNIEDQSILETCIVNETSDYFKFSTLSLPHRRRWNVNVLPYDCNQNPVSDTIELSTHDIQNVTVTSPSPGEVRVTYDLIQHATAKGLLAIIYSLEFGKMNIYYFQELAHTEIKNLSASMHGVPAGHYGVSVFSIEHGGLPFNRTALTPKEVYVPNTAEMSETESCIQYTISQDNGEECIECTFADDSNGFCVVIVHKTLSCNALPCEQDLMSINASYKFNRSGDKARGCIGGIDFKTYQVGVIGGILVSGFSPPARTACSHLCAIITAGTGLLVLVLPVVLVLVLLQCYRRKKKSIRSYLNDSYATEFSAEASERYQTPPTWVELDNIRTSSIRTTVTYLDEDESELPCYDEETSQEKYGEIADNSEIKTSEDRDWQEQVTSCTDQSHLTPFSSVTRQPAVFNSKALTSKLVTVAHKWRDIGEAIYLDEDILDAIVMNSETNEECLRHMVELYMKRSDLNHDWEEVSIALRKVGEHALAEEISRMDTHSQDVDKMLITEDIAIPYPVAESVDGYEGRTHLTVTSAFHESAPIIGTTRYINQGRVSLSRHVNYSVIKFTNLESIILYLNPNVVLLF